MYESYLNLLAELRSLTNNNSHAMVAVLGVSRPTVRKWLNAKEDDYNLYYSRIEKVVAQLKKRSF